MKRTIIATKANFTHTNLNDILMYQKRKPENHSSLAAILDAILY